MRDTFSKSLVDLVSENSNVYVLSGDHGYALFDALRTKMPDHFINAGVAEQNMVGVAAGLSKLGLYPIIYGLSAFVPIRVLEQIKIDFCYEGLPGLFIGDGAGIVYSHLGTSHQSTEDIAALRAIPEISILSPCDKYELKACFDWAVQQKSTVYLRMGKADLADVHEKLLLNLSSEPLSVVQNNNSVVIFATGSMVSVCLKLIKDGKVKADLYSVPVIKSKEKNNIKIILKKYSRAITVEEHSIHGGLGDMISAIAAEDAKIQVRKIGIEDRFSQACGTYQFLMKEHGLDIDSVEHKING